MSLWLVLILCAIVLLIGIAIGYVLRLSVGAMSAYNGTIHVTKEDDKIVYSLDLEEDPELLQYKSEVVFKIKTSE